MLVINPNQESTNSSFFWKRPHAFSFLIYQGTNSLSDNKILSYGGLDFNALLTQKSDIIHPAWSFRWPFLTTQVMRILLDIQEWVEFSDFYIHIPTAWSKINGVSNAWTWQIGVSSALLKKVNSGGTISFNVALPIGTKDYWVTWVTNFSGNTYTLGAWEKAYIEVTLSAVSFNAYIEWYVSNGAVDNKSVIFV
jgi:hypothetical protein